MTLQTYTEHFTVRQADCDLYNRMFPGALLKLTQQIATDHCARLGMDAAYYERTHRAFLLAKVSLRWDRAPGPGEELVLCTYPELPHRAVYKRVTQVCNQQMEQLGLVDSRWVLIDTHTRHILRRLPEDLAGLPFAERVELELPIAFPKPQQLEPAGEAWAKYSYCDLNGHLNNTHYADIACDALPLEALKAPIREVTINYHSEIEAGQGCSLQRGLVEPGTWYVAGDKDGKCCFEAIVKA